MPDPNTPSETFVAVFQRFAGLPAHMFVQVSATYTSASGKGLALVLLCHKLPSLVSCIANFSFKYLDKKVGGLILSISFKSHS